MGLPPVTPAPSRFLPPKRSSTQQSQNQTPNQQYVSRPHQFHATPRFSTTPRPSSTQARPAFTTPALTIKTRISRSRSTQDIIDDSSPIFAEEDTPSAFPATRDVLPEPIEFEFESSLIPQSQSPEHFEDGRSPKRRRISIASSEPESEPLASSPQDLEDADLDSLPDALDDHIVSFRSELDDVDDDEDGHELNPPISPTQSITSSPPPRIPLPKPAPVYSSSSSSGGEEEDDDDDDDEDEPFSSQDPNPRHTHTHTHSNQPAFHPAPRFKPPDPLDPNNPHPNDAYHPDIFSPQRRGGAKYLAGGLAAELRDWLVDVKEGGGDGEGRLEGSSVVISGSGAAGVVRVVVDEVCCGGPGMTLVSGRVVDARGAGGVSVRVILAGEGKVEGLGQGRRGGGGNPGLVVPGAVVVVAPPAWDVELDGRWAVAYRWEAVEGSEKGQ